MAARNKWLESYDAIVSLEVLCKLCTRLMLSKQNPAYVVPDSGYACLFSREFTLC